MILLRLLGLVLDVLFLPLRLVVRARAVPPGAFVSLTVDGAVADLVAPPPRWRLWTGPRPSAVAVHAVAEVVDAVVVDARVRGVVVTVKRLGCGMASATSLRAQLERVRAAGKEVLVHLPMGGATKEVYLASVATKLVVGPTAQLAPLGFLSAKRYAKRALDRAGLDVEVFACGEYKAAGEALVRDSMSDAQREQLEALLDGFDAVVVRAIAEGRGTTEERARALIDGGPYFGPSAVEAGLADAVGYDDEIPALAFAGAARRETRGARRRGPRVATSGMIPAEAYRKLVRRPLVRRLRRGPLIAVVPVHGTIAHADGPVGRFSTDERVARMVRGVRRDPRVVGVVLHVDSPGGSALASDRMHHELQQLAREKPLVACFANVAASGGYYVAAPAHRIVAEATTITGSIGVVAARFGIEPLLRRLGITTEIVRRGARVGLLSPALPLGDDERAALNRELDATYGAFLGVVAAGRKLPREQVENLARGRVYTGAHAHASRLIDVLGGFEAALSEVRAMLPADVRDRAEPHLVKRPRHPVPLLEPPADGEPFDPGDGARRARMWLASAAAALLPRGEQALLELAAQGERVLLLYTEADGEG